MGCSDAPKWFGSIHTRPIRPGPHPTRKDEYAAIIWKESRNMKNILLAVGGFCAAAAGILVWHTTRTPNVAELAHSLEEAWADHHTSA
jgi:hypothetical protein